MGKVILVAILALALAVGFVAGWARSNALTDQHHKLAAGTSVLCLAGFVAINLSAAVWLILPTTW